MALQSFEQARRYEVNAAVNAMSIYKSSANREMITVFFFAKVVDEPLGDNDLFNHQKRSSDRKMVFSVTFRNEA